MAAVRHLPLVDAYLDHTRRVLCGLCHCAKFGWNCSGFDIMKLFDILCICLEMAYSHA